jgi:hypothetical protein
MHTKHCFNNTDRRRCRDETSKHTPVIDDQPGANNVRTPIDGASLVANISNAIVEEEERIGQTTRGTCNRLESSSWTLDLKRSFWADEPSLVCDLAVRA